MWIYALRWSPAFRRQFCLKRVLRLVGWCRGQRRPTKNPGKWWVFAALDTTLQPSLGTLLALFLGALPAAAQQGQVEHSAFLQRAAADPCYPKYHVAPPFGWMNDPHPIFFKGCYHIFYQYSFLPDSPYGGPHSWGHAVSSDLIHWRHMPVAISPKDHGIAPDRHIWSGCVVDNNGRGAAIYTIENIDVWSAASADADLAVFRRGPANPVIKGPPPGLAIEGGMRDPWAWKEADAWYLIVGSGIKGGKGPVLPLYTSSDLVHWRYLHPLYEGSAARGEGRFCECPSFFPLKGKHVLALSHEATYLTGRYEQHRFIPERHGRLEYGAVYVPQFVLDAKGRRIMWGWVQETRPRDAQRLAGWASMQTLPRVVSLARDGSLNFEPADELAALRSEPRTFENIALPADATRELEGVGGGQLELAAEFAPAASGQSGIALLDKNEKTEILFDAKTKTIRCGGRSAPLELSPGERLTMRVFVDGSVIEVFANRRVCLTERFYPARPERLRAALVARGAPATVRRVNAWKMGTIWGEK
jgi:beta-fructofuranosidase